MINHYPDEFTGRRSRRLVCACGNELPCPNVGDRVRFDHGFMDSEEGEVVGSSGKMVLVKHPDGKVYPRNPNSLRVLRRNSQPVYKGDHS
jgi:hypothetical protein